MTASTERIAYSVQGGLSPEQLDRMHRAGLRVAGDAVAIALDYVRRGRPACLGISTMPIVGLSSPITLPGAFVENIATVLGTFALFKMMGVKNEMIFHFDAYPFDMKWASMAYGTPEHILIHLLGSQVNRYYDPQVNDARPFHTNAVTPDSHAQVQRASFAAVAALNGSRRFTFGGMPGIDRVYQAYVSEV